VAPPSLANIFGALEKDYPGEFKRPPNKGGLLTPWADQGVLLLNTVLTVRAHEANSHQKKGWEKFTQRVIDVVAKRREGGVVFLAWGKPAQERITGVNGTKHLVLKGIHPSPLAARAGDFKTCGHFRKANEWLRERYGVEGEVDWRLDGSAAVKDLDKGKDVKGLEVDKAVMVGGEQEPVPKEPQPMNVAVKTNGEQAADEFDDDLDAIEAIETLAKSSQVDGEQSSSTVKEDSAHNSLS
jgi:uracil-DNA glycosylase